MAQNKPQGSILYIGIVDHLENPLSKIDPSQIRRQILVEKWEDIFQ